MGERPAQHSVVAPTEASERLRFEELLADLSARFVNVPAERVDQEIVDAQRQLCRFLGADRSSLWQGTSGATRVLRLTHACTLGEAQSDPPEATSDLLFPWCTQQLLEGKLVVIPDVAALPAEAEVDRTNLLAFGDKSTLVIPFTMGEEPVYGALTFDNTTRQTDWAETAAGRCRLIAQVFANALVHRRSEQALRESRATLKAIVDSTSDFIWSVDAKSFGLLTFNGAIRDFVRARLDVHLQRGMRPDDIFADERHVQIWRAFYQQALAGGQFVTRHVSLQGGDPVVLQLALHVLERDGEVFGISVFGKDVTEQTRAEERLRAAESAQRALIDAVDDSLFLTTPDGTMTVVNEALARRFGKTVEEMTGTDTYSLLPKDVAERRRAFIRQVVESGQPLRVDDERAGHHVESRLYPVRNTQGQVTHVAILGRDVTSRKRAESDLRRAKEQAEAANAAKDRFISMLSHELRTPLNPALAATSVLAGDPSLPQSVREELAMVSRNIALEARLIDDLLDTTHVVAGKLRLRLEHVDVAEVLREVVQMCNPDAQRKGLHLTADMVDAPYPMVADVTRLHQVFWNLVRNAIKFTGQGGTITIRAWRTMHQNEARLRVTVRDSGMGIEAHVLPRLFRPFEQGERIINDTYGGLGLGLPIAKAVVEHHGGEIRAESPGAGHGATFTVELPLSRSVSAPEDHPVRPAEASIAPENVGPLRILVVEDHADTAKLLRKLLRAKGHEVAIAGDMTTALASAKASQFDVLICDLGLPDGTGHDLMRHLRAEGYSSPGIAVSGYGSPADVERSRAAGFAEHLIKPVDLAAIDAALRRIVGAAAVVKR